MSSEREYGDFSIYRKFENEELEDYDKEELESIIDENYEYIQDIQYINSSLINYTIKKYPDSIDYIDLNLISSKKLLKLVKSGKISIYDIPPKKFNKQISEYIFNEGI